MLRLPLAKYAATLQASLLTLLLLLVQAILGPKPLRTTSCRVQLLHASTPVSTVMLETGRRGCLWLWLGSC